MRSEVDMTCCCFADLLCMLFFRRAMRDPDVDCLVLMSPAQSESL